MSQENKTILTSFERQNIYHRLKTYLEKEEVWFNVHLPLEDSAGDILDDLTLKMDYLEHYTALSKFESAVYVFGRIKAIREIMKELLQEEIERSKGMIADVLADLRKGVLKL